MTDRLPSERVVVSAPMSFAGAAARAWKLTVYPHGTGWNTAVRAATITGVILLILAWWALVACWFLFWYVLCGILFLPFLITYRVIRRGARRRKIERLQHAEMMAAVYRGKEITR